MLKLIAVTFSLCVALCSATFGQSRPEPLELAPRVLSDSFAGHISSFRDVDRVLTIETALQRLSEDAFAPVASSAPNFGFTEEPIWLYIPVANPTEATQWRFRLRENFFQEFSAWFVPENGVPQQLEFQDETTGFHTRVIQWSELVVPFSLQPGGTGAIVMRYRSGGSTEVEFTMFDAPTFAEWMARMTARNFTYYGMLVFLIVASLATWVGTRQGIFLAYSCYGASALLFLMHGDGNTFRYLWPNAPAFNAFATVPLGAGIICFGANYSRQFLQTWKYHPIFDKLLLGTIVVTLAMAASTVFGNTQMIKKILVLMAFLSVLLFTAAGINAARTRFREVRFYVIAWTGAVVSSAIMTSRHWFGVEISEEVQFNSMRIVFVLDAALMGLAILDRFNALRRSRSEALETALAEAESNLQLTRRLQTLEQRFAWASDLAETREQQVANAIHDLRQPLHSLRMKVHDMLQNPQRTGATSGQDIERTFGFLEKLVNEELDGHVSDTRQTDQVAVAEIFDAVAQMFAKEADAKGLQIEVGQTQAHVTLPAMAVMRTMSNLLGNAVRYTQAGKIMLSAVDLPDGALRLEVHDTGPGLSQTEFEALVPRGARASDEKGSGLGLAIVAETCARHDLHLEWLPPVLSGTSIGVTIPYASVV